MVLLSLWVDRLHFCTDLIYVGLYSTYTHVLQVYTCVSLLRMLMLARCRYLTDEIMDGKTSCNCNVCSTNVSRSNNI